MKQNESYERHEEYLQCVEQSLIRDYLISDEDAQCMVRHSWFLESIRKNAEYIKHHRPEYWASELYRDYQLIRA
ncbi:hypothetical protein [Tumebacillus avium]|uniref:hypothetical protein n=1 Tax=Tumebacillus avium TaxID=1903704 RepID=UPI0012FDA1EE|nr:hypothetical protein [Tumebacillus avium]